MKINKKLTKFLPWLLVLLLLATTAFFAWQYFTTNDGERDDNYTLSDEKETPVLDSLADVYSLPTRDNVTITYIGNPDSFEGSDKLKNARQGDYFVKFSHHNHAVLWRDNEEKIISVLNTQSIIDVIVAGVSEKYARDVAELIEQSSPSVSVRSLRANNTENVSSNTIVVNNQQFAESAQSLAKALSGTVSDIPQGETKDEEASMQIYLAEETEVTQ